MKDESPVRKKLPFAAEKASRQFEHDLTLVLIKEIDARLRNHVHAENQQIFYHGREWKFLRQEGEGYVPRSGELKPQHVDISIKIDRILANDVTLVSDFLKDTADSFENQFVRQLVEEVSSVTEGTGNTIAVTKETSLADAFMEMVRTREMLVGPDGKVSLPRLYLFDKGQKEKLERAIAERGPEFKKQIEELQKKKEKEALDREAERLARYDGTE